MNKYYLYADNECKYVVSEEILLTKLSELIDTYGGVYVEKKSEQNARV